ncbi:MAG: entericidin [Candidatus Omnitrophica bacterium]|nr:entericidin [Candidatus Omnitrophota bacterium]
MKKITAFLLSLLMVSVLIGCETWRGAGRDLEEAGEEMQKS